MPTETMGDWVNNMTIEICSCFFASCVSLNCNGKYCAKKDKAQCANYSMDRMKVVNDLKTIFVFFFVRRNRQPKCALSMSIAHRLSVYLQLARDLQTILHAIIN